MKCFNHHMEIPIISSSLCRILRNRLHHCHQDQLLRSCVPIFFHQLFVRYKPFSLIHMWWWFHHDLNRSCRSNFSVFLRSKDFMCWLWPLPIRNKLFYHFHWHRFNQIFHSLDPMCDCRQVFRMRWINLLG